MTTLDLSKFIDGPHSYDSSAQAVADAAVEAFNQVAGALGITGFQAQWAALTAYAKILNIKGPIIVLRGDDLLYPQYDIPARVQAWIEECHPWLSERAAELLEEQADNAVESVVAHWYKLASS